MDIIAQLVANSLIAAGIYALVAIGFNLAFGATKFFNLAHGAQAVVGGYTVFFFKINLGVNIVISIVLGIVTAGLVGLLLDKVIYLPLRLKKASNMILLVASLGALTAIEAIIAMLSTNRFRTLSENTAIHTYQIGGASFSAIHIIIVLSALFCTTILILLLKKTKFGKTVEAISDDEEVAKIVGIDTNKIIGAVFFISGAIAGIAGILVGFDTGLLPTMGLQLLLKGIIAAIVGGIGNIYGALLGAFILSFAENFGVFATQGAWKDAIAFAMLIIFLIFRPNGIIKK